MDRGLERSKAVRLLQPGDRARTTQPSAEARIISCAPSARTMVKHRRARPGDPPVVGIIVVFEVTSGPQRGERGYEILHPDEEVLQ